jgi:hypothetical protein
VFGQGPRQWTQTAANCRILSMIVSFGNNKGLCPKHGMHTCHASPIVMLNTEGAWLFPFGVA